MCVPSVCSGEEVAEGLNQFLHNELLTETLNITLPSAKVEQCVYKDMPIEATTLDWVAVVIFSVIGCVILISSLLDVTAKYLDSNYFSNKFQGSFQGFSLYTNIGKLLDTHQPPGAIKCLNGIRFLSMTWVLAGHIVLLYLFQASSGVSFSNPLTFINTESFIWTDAYSIIWNAQDAVDSFFLMGAILLSYLTIKVLI